MMRKCRLFQLADRKFIAALATYLVPEVYLPSQFIVVAGHVSLCMYFVKRGRVQVIHSPPPKKTAPKTATHAVFVQIDSLS